MTVFGLHGYGGSGKDSIGDILVEHHGFTKLAFADPLREMAAALNPIVGFLHGTPYRYLDALDQYGYQAAKGRFPEVRMYLQRLGTEAGREVLGDNVWVDATMAKIDPDGRYVICDMRFPNELDAVTAAGGVSVRVHRSGVGPANSHESEVALDPFVLDDIIDNCGDLANLRYEVDLLVKRWT